MFFAPKHGWGRVKEVSNCYLHGPFSSLLGYTAMGAHKTVKDILTAFLISIQLEPYFNKNKKTVFVQWLVEVNAGLSHNFLQYILGF